jgi:integrase
MNTQTFQLDQFHSYLQSDYRKVTHRQLNEKSVKLAMQHIRVFGLWHEDKFNQTFEPGNLTNYDLHVYRKYSLDEKKVEAATWNSRHWALGILCVWLGHPELMDGIELKEQMEGSEKHRALTDLEHHRLVNIIELDTRRGKDNPLQALTVFEYQIAIRNWAAISLMLHAGLRVDECAMVKVGDITIKDRSGIVMVRNGKGGKRRKVTINLPLRNALKAYLELKPASKTLFGICPRSLQRITNDIGKRIGVPDLTPHWLRYTFAKRMENNGVPLEAIRRLLGHKNIETTKVYLRSSMEDLQSAVDSVM